MPRGTTLLSMVDMLRHETRKSTAVNAGVDQADSLKHVLRRVQWSLYMSHDWPFLRVFPTKALAAGQRYYDWPATISPERVDTVAVRYGGEYITLDRGIGSEQYSEYDSDEDERADPVQFWDMRWTGSATQIEVWPIPATTSDVLRFKGLRPLLPFVADDAVCTLDDYLIVLYAAIELLPKESEDRKIKYEAANKLLHDLVAANAKPTTMTIMGGGPTVNLPRPRIVRVS